MITVGMTFPNGFPQFMTFTCIRTHISLLRSDDVKSMFDEIPELLADVQEEDMKLHAVRATKGLSHRFFSPSHLVWVVLHR